MCVYVLCELVEIIFMYGVFMDVFGVGVLIIGDFGVGKSEFGFELILCGYGLVVDDVVEIFWVVFGMFEGCCLVLLCDFFEVCGFGLLNICIIFGEMVSCCKMCFKFIVYL